jgi:hypothetical protein
MVRHHSDLRPQPQCLTLSHALNIVTARCRGQPFFVPLDFDVSFGISPILE